MDPTIALLIVCTVLLVALLLERRHVSHFHAAVMTWADNHGYQILELRRHVGSVGGSWAQTSRVEQVFVVKVLDPDDRIASFLVRTGVYFLGNCIRPFEAYSVDEAGLT